MSEFPALQCTVLLHNYGIYLFLSVLAAGSLNTFPVIFHTAAKTEVGGRGEGWSGEGRGGVEQWGEEGVEGKGRTPGYTPEGADRTTSGNFLSFPPLPLLYLPLLSPSLISPPFPFHPLPFPPFPSRSLLLSPFASLRSSLLLSSTLLS